MCTIAILVHACDMPLAIAANRDEMYARASRPPELLAIGLAGGIDVVSGGTWLALRADGSFAAVTNQRTLVPPPVGVRSRGLIVRDLATSSDPERFVRGLDPRAYASMNLAWGDANGAYVAYLRHDDGTRDIVKLEDGVHVLANDRIDAPGFPRAERLKAAILASPPQWDALTKVLRRSLADHTKTEGGAAHLAPELARELTATCIHTPYYGTRSSTLAALERGRVHAYLHADGPPCTTPYVDYTKLLHA